MNNYIKPHNIKIMSLSVLPLHTAQPLLTVATTARSLPTHLDRQADNL